MRDRDREAILQLLADEGLLPSGLDPNHPPSEFSEALSLALHRFLARTDSRAVAVQLEDMLMLQDQFNLPGTVNEYPNWRQKILEPIESLFEHETVKNIVQTLRDERP
jgi:4-alpha-glucanotransferase